MVEKENPAIKRILNTELVRQFFSYWPAFHDAEITKVVMEANPGFHAAVTFVIKASKNTREVDESGPYVLAKHCEIEIRFTGIRELEFDYFGHQNVVFEAVFEEVDRDVKCTFNASVGLDAVIVAEEITILKLTPTEQKILRQAQQDK